MKSLLPKPPLRQRVNQWFAHRFHKRSIRRSSSSSAGMFSLTPMMDRLGRHHFVAVPGLQPYQVNALILTLFLYIVWLFYATYQQGRVVDMTQVFLTTVESILRVALGDTIGVFGEAVDLLRDTLALLFPR
ncbi:hypothetical protein BCR43DRAFT_518918 [Syncephalastrum racemosum]|uniref:Uncharacterized protein n=1 Tax=Syncephalastrum racemosum TaxID=13706 RepID=A0A1X2H051_SYNRA|nr:hypothetical protein BCR43DRAFT_518918 [Syncephalastrum racemosum]